MMVGPRTEWKILGWVEYDLFVPVVAVASRAVDPLYGCGLFFALLAADLLLVNHADKRLRREEPEYWKNLPLYERY